MAHALFKLGASKSGPDCGGTCAQAGGTEGDGGGTCAQAGGTQARGEGEGASLLKLAGV